MRSWLIQYFHYAIHTSEIFLRRKSQPTLVEHLQKKCHLAFCLVLANFTKKLQKYWGCKKITFHWLNEYHLFQPGNLVTNWIIHTWTNYHAPTS